jgi:DNA-binding transcriptional MerR regulator
LRFKEKNVPAIKNMTIGRLADLTGCSPPTIRYYESIGLLPRPSRSGGKQRIYQEADQRRLMFIRRCRDFGFPVQQVRELAALAGASDRDCVAARDLAQNNLSDVRNKLKELRALERSLKQFVDDCSARCAGGPANACVILEELATATAPSCCGSERG